MRLAWATRRCSRRYASSHTSRADDDRSTSVTSARRSSARSMSRCSNCTPRSTARPHDSLSPPPLATSANDGQLLHADQPHRIAAGDRAGPRHRRSHQGGRPRAGAAGSHRLRSRLRFRTLPHRCGQPHRQAPCGGPRQDPEPAPEAIRHALRDVVSRCLYGVDVNPMAVELCKVSLWLEALEPGRRCPFSTTASSAATVFSARHPR